MAGALGTGTLGFISDHETKVDLLRNKAIAATIIDIIGTDDTRPLTIGVHGYWGAGKSSVLEMIAEHEFGDEKTLVVRFNGWQFEGFEDAKIALIEGVVDQLMANKTIYAKAKDQLFSVVKRIDWLKAAKRSVGFAFTAATGLPSPDQALGLAKMALSSVPAIANLVTPDNIESAASVVGEYIKEGEDQSTVAKNIREFRAEFEELIEKAGLNRLIVLVDDLDRCLPETAIQTLEAIRLFVMLPKTAFVIGADETMIKYAVTKHFPDLPSESASQDYPRAYLEKLIQVPFRIPSMGEAETRTYLTLLVVGALIGDSSDPFKRLLAKAEEMMSSPWLQKSIGDADVSAALGTAYTQPVASAVTLADRIAPMLASGTGGNPRNVKRFMNSLTLRLAVARARGFGPAIDGQVLAKLMLAEQFASTVFDGIASDVGTSADGTSAGLALLEQRCALPPEVLPVTPGQEPPTSTPNEAPDPNPPPPPPNTALTARVDSWLTLMHVEDWARQHPLIGAVDLRPYLFVVNDIKAYSVSGSALDPALVAIVEKITRGSMVAATAMTSLVSLGVSDQKRVFEELRRVVLSTANWSVRPPALDGIGQAVNKVPAFETRYLELLSHLPPQSLGRWAASGHDAAVRTQPGKAKLAEIIETWKRTGSADLKTAIRVAGGPR